MRKSFALFLLILATAGAWAQQEKSQRPSPPAPPAVCKFAGGNTITVEYSTPSMKGRKIYGALVPYGEIWRTGANEATTFVTTVNLSIGGQAVPAGSYTAYTIPGEKSWKLVLSKKTGQWGIPYPEGQDLGRYEMKTEVIEVPVEKLHISFLAKPGAKGVCTLRIDWEKTRALVDIVEQT